MEKVFCYFFFSFMFLAFSFADQAVGKELNFVHLTDVHVAPGKKSERKLQSIVHEINEGNYDFVVLSGDLTNLGSDAELLAVKKLLEQLTIPYYVVSGNHETNWSESVGKSFQKLFGDDNFVFEAGDFLFVGFATGPYMRMGDGHLKEENLDWLKKTLEKYKSKNKKLITVAHYPLSEGLDNWYKITDLIKPYNPAFALCGHGHDLSLHNFDGIIGIMGRATYERNKPDVAGYNLIKLKGDSVFVFEKIIANSEKRLISRFDVKNPDAVLANLSSSSRPDFSINNEFPEIIPNFMFEDKSSIFTAAVPTPNGFVSTNSIGELCLWEIKNNQASLKWKNQYEGSIYSTPIVAGEFLFCATITGYLYALNIKTGDVKWSTFLGKPIIADAILDGKHLYVSAGNNIYKLETKRGTVLWKNESPKGQLQGKAWVDQEDLIFGAWDTYLYCLEKKTGNLKWKWTNGKTAPLLSPGNVSPVAYKGKVFIVAPDRYMTAIDKKSGETIWRTKQHQVRESMGISKDGKLVYAKLMNDSVIAVSTESEAFNLVWAVDAGFAYEHNPCPLMENNGVLYAAGKNGLLVALDKNSGQLKWKYKAGNSSVNQITTDSKGNIWISLVEGKIFRFGDN